MYTVLDQNGLVEARDISLAEAAKVVLQAGGRQFEIRARVDGQGYRLWTASAIGSHEKDAAAAERDIFLQIIGQAAAWSKKVVVLESDYQKAMDNIE